MSAPGLSIALTTEQLEALVDALAPLVAARLAEREASPPELLTVEEVAQILRADRQRVYDLISRGRPPRLKDGSRVLVGRSALDAHLRDGGAG